MRPEWTPPPPEAALELDASPESDSDGEMEEFDGEAPEWMPGLTAEEERRAITDLAMRQLTERPGGTIRSADTLRPASSFDDAENMRNKALADFMARQQQMAKDRPPPAPAARGSRGGPAVVQKTSGWTISPNLTTKPTMTGAPSGFSPELEAQAGMSRLKVDRNSRESRAARPPRASRERPLRAGEGRSARPEGGDPNGSVEPGRPEGGDSNGLMKPRRADGSALSGPVKPGRKVAPGPKVLTVVEVGSAPDIALATAPAGMARAVRNRPVPRRMATRAAATSEPDARWRVLAELADLLAEEVFPGDTLPDVCRWLAGSINATVAIVLLADDTIDDVSAWPADDPLVGYLSDLVGEPLDEQSTIWTSVGEGRTITAEVGDEPLMLPDGVGQPGVGGWAVVPVIDRAVAFGTILVTRPDGDVLPEATVSLVEEVARRVARALLNCEEAASNSDASGQGNASTGGGLSDHQVPGPIRDRLGALSFVLGAIESPPRSGLAHEQNRRYADIVTHAAELQIEVTDFLCGHEDSGR